MNPIQLVRSRRLCRGSHSERFLRERLYVFLENHSSSRSVQTSRLGDFCIDWSASIVSGLSPIKIVGKSSGNREIVLTTFKQLTEPLSRLSMLRRFFLGFRPFNNTDEQYNRRP